MKNIIYENATNYNESQIEEISTGGAFADPMQQVCHLLLLGVSHCPHF